MSLRVAILGLGQMGSNHLRILSMLKDVVVSNVFDIDHERSEKLSELYQVPFTTDLEEALSDIDAVVIATPTKTHFEYFKLSSEKVKNIFIEKPIAETVAEAAEIKVLSDSKNIFVQCGFIERFNPVIQELRNVLKLERVINSDFFRTNRLSDRIKDVDVVLDLMIHDIDLAIFLNGPVGEINAYGRRENDLVAFASVTIEHENGAFSRLLASRITEKKIRLVQVTTSNTYIEAELFRKELQLHRQSRSTASPGSSYIVSSLGEQIEVKPQEALLVQLQAFLSGCMGEKLDYLPGPVAGLEALRVAEKVVGSID